MSIARKYKINAGIMAILSLGYAGGLASPASAAPAIVENAGYGLSYGEWSARWWQWLLSIPAATNPNVASGATNCAIGQAGDVWFLGGSFGATAERSCTIPQGKALFFPVINTIIYKPGGKETLNNLRQQAAAFIENTTPGSLSCTVDGEPCAADLPRFRATSPSFSLLPPTGGLIPPGKLTLPGRADPLVSDGYWMLLKPLAARTAPYVIRFGAVNGPFTVDVTYQVTVAAP